MLMSPSLMTQKPKCYFSLVFLTLMLSWVKFNRIKTYWNAWFQWIRFGIGCLCDRKIQKFKSSMLQSPYSGYLSTCSWTSYQQCTLWSHVSYSDLPRIELVHGYGDTVQANVRFAIADSLPLTKLFTLKYSVIQLVLSVGSGFIFWAIFGYSIWIVFAV